MKTIINIIVKSFIKLYKTFIVIFPLAIICYVFSFKYLSYMMGGIKDPPPKYVLYLALFMTFYFLLNIAGLQLYLINNFIKLFDGTYIDRESAMAIFGIPANSRFARYKGTDGSRQTELFLEVFFISLVNIVIRLAIFALVCKYFLTNGSSFAFSFFPTTREILLFLPILFKKVLMLVFNLSPFS